MRLLLFDVDGTLILSSGAGMRAYHRAFQRVFDVDVDREVIRPDGKTDPWIAREMLAYFSLEKRWSEETRDALFSTYLEMLEVEMSLVAAGGALHVLPGVASLLDTLARLPDFALGLATGNFRKRVASLFFYYPLLSLSIIALIQEPLREVDLRRSFFAGDFMLAPDFPPGGVRREFFSNHFPHHFESRPPVHVFKQRIVDQGLVISSTRIVHDVSEVLEHSVIQAD